MQQPDAEMISYAQLAAETGRSRSAISQLAKAGRITVFPGHRVHRAVALAELAKLRPRSKPVAAPGQPATQSDAPTYATSRARREHAAAEREEIALRREQGELMLAREVTAAVDDAATTLRIRLESLPDILAHVLANESDEHRVRALLGDAIEDALGNLAQRFGEIARGAP